MAWRFLAQRLNGDGTGTFVSTDLPLGDVTFTSTLSGDFTLSGAIDPRHPNAIGADGQPIIRQWSTAIYPEIDGLIRGGGIATGLSFDGPVMQIDAVGFTGYPRGMPYTDSWYGVEIDPLDAARHIWTHLQGKAGGDLGLVLDGTTSPVRIGEELEEVEFETGEGELVQFEAGPYKLAWWVTDDLGREFDDLAAETPFEYLEEHSWNEGQTDIVHRLRLGYPRLGRRRPDLRFVLGENVAIMPSISRPEEDYASEVLVLGSGEGQDMIRGLSGRSTAGRLRRVSVVDDKAIQSKTRANDRAARELARLNGDIEVATIEIRNHSHAPVGSFSPGDEIRLQADTDWVNVDDWFRILTVTTNPSEGDAMTAAVVRADAMAL